MVPILQENGVPHLNQTAYQPGLSSHEATFVVQEVVRKYIREGVTMHQVFYDLDKAYDTVESNSLSSSLMSTRVASMVNPGE